MAAMVAFPNYRRLQRDVNVVQSGIVGRVSHDTVCVTDRPRQLKQYSEFISVRTR